MTVRYAPSRFNRRRTAALHPACVARRACGPYCENGQCFAGGCATAVREYSAGPGRQETAREDNTAKQSLDRFALNVQPGHIVDQVATRSQHNNHCRPVLSYLCRPWQPIMPRNIHRAIVFLRNVFRPMVMSPD